MYAYIKNYLLYLFGGLEFESSLVLNKKYLWLLSNREKTIKSRVTIFSKYFKTK